jgi:hypothetical protein
MSAFDLYLFDMHVERANAQGFMPLTLEQFALRIPCAW